MKAQVTIGAGICGFFAGLLVAGGMGNNPLKTISVAGLVSLPTIFVANLLIDTKAQNLINEAQSTASKAELKANNAESELSKIKLLLSTRETYSDQLEQRLSQLEGLLKSAENDRSKLSGMVEQLNPLVNQLQTQLSEAREQVAELEDEVEAWKVEFNSRVDVEADRRLQMAKKAEIDRIFAEHDAITSEAMALFRELQQWGYQVAESHRAKRQLITDLAGSYNQNLDELNESVDREREALLTQIECLRDRIAQLQAELAGDLVEPVYLDCGFDESGRIANALARWLWVNRQLPLKVTGFEINSDGTLTTGFTYSRSVTPEALIKAIDRDSSQIAKSLGLYAIEKAYKLPIADCLAIKVRRDRPARKTDRGSLYRSKEEFVKYVLSQPVRLRVIGEPGSGKTPTVTVLLSHILYRGFLEANTPSGRKLPYCVVESCNPLAGISVKNSDELDFCLCWTDGKKGFKGLVEEYRFRKNPANADYKNQVGYIWVADEIDNTMAELTKDEAKPFKDALKDGGHVNLGVIVMGQSAMVSTSKGLSIDDQKMMTNIYIDPVSIRTFLTQYGERFYSKKAVEKALATLEELELEIEEQNELICDTARELRIAMVTANRSPVFYQLPYFDSVEIDQESYQETLAKVSGIRDGRGETGMDANVSSYLESPDLAGVLGRKDLSRHYPYAVSGTRLDKSVKPSCPHCGSHNIRSKGDKWLCQNPEHSLVASDKPKSWKK